MKKLRASKKTIWMTALAGMFLLTGIVFAAVDEDGTYKSRQEGLTSQQTQSMQQSHNAQKNANAGLLCRANDLIGSQVTSSTVLSDDSPANGVENNNTENGSDTEKPSDPNQESQDAAAMTIGTIEELILDDSQNEICYVVLNSDDKLYPVPWQAFDVRKSAAKTGWTGQNISRTNQGNMPTSPGQPAEMPASTADRSGSTKPSLCLKLSKDQLSQAPSIDAVSLDQLQDLQFLQKVDDFYSQHVGKITFRQNMAGTSRRDEVSRSYEEMASSVGTRGALLMASEVIGLDLQSTGQADLGSIEDLVIDTRKGQIAYALVSFGGFMNIGEKIAAVPWTSLTVQPDQQVAQINATEDQLNAAVIDKDNIDKLSQPQFARQIHSSFNVEPYWGVYGFIGEEATPAGTMQPWQAGSKYNKKFDPDKMTNIEGTITSVGTFYPESGASAGTKLQVKTKDGQTMTVYAGPQYFASRKEIIFKSDAQVTVSGSKADINGQSVILASEIKVDGKTLRLRDRQGNPLWTTGQSQEKLDQQRNRDQQQDQQMRQNPQQNQSPQKQY